MNGSYLNKYIFGFFWHDERNFSLRKLLASYTIIL
jgi:hypothetical protein